MRSLCRTVDNPSSPRGRLNTKLFQTLAICLAACCSVRSVSAQQRDASAIAFLNQAVNAAGGSTAITEVQDFTAQGTITHYWADDPEQGQLTVKARGLSQFRIDSSLPEGTWSYIVNNGTGEFALPDGNTIPLATHNTLNAAALTLPIVNVNAALSDTTTTIIDRGTVQFGPASVRQIRIQRSVGSLSNLAQRDYFFDPSSFLLLEVKDFAHPDDDAANGSMTHILDFGNYQNVNGVLNPFSISEILFGQQTWAMQLISVAFNTGLSDPDFQF